MARLLFSLLAVALLRAALTLAQSPPGPAASGTTSTATIFLLDADPQPLLASVVDVAAPKTTYLVNCQPTSPDGDDCGIHDARVTVAPSAWDFTQTDAGWAFSAHCDLSGTQAQMCTVTNEGSEANDPGTSTFSPDATDQSFLPVTITAGADKMMGATASATSSSSSSSPAAMSSSMAMPASSASATASATPTMGSASGTASLAASSSSVRATGAASSKGGSHLLGAVAGVGAAAVALW